MDIMKEIKIFSSTPDNWSQFTDKNEKCSLFYLVKDSCNPLNIN